MGYFMSMDESIAYLLSDQFGLSLEYITPEASFTRDLGMDSLDCVEFIMTCEKEFGVSIPDEEAEKLTTVHLAARWLESAGAHGLMIPVVITPDPPNPPNPPVDPPIPGGGGGGGGGGTPVNPPPPPEPGFVITPLKNKYPCFVKKIIAGLKATQQFRAIIQPFLSTYNKPSITFDSANMEWGLGGYFQGGETSIDNGSTISASSTVVLNKWMIEQASELLNAAITIHETYHANLNFAYAWRNEAGFVPDFRINSLGATPADIAAANSIFLSNSSTPNYSHHYIMVTVKFTSLVDLLYTYGGGRFSLQDCRKAMLHGLDRPDNGCTQAEKDNLDYEFNRTLAIYGITKAELTTFYDLQRNPPAAMKVPDNCPE